MNTLIHHFTWFDATIIGIIAISIIVSFFRGFMREAISLVVWFLAFVCALKLAAPLSQLFSGLISIAVIRYGVAFFSIFLMVWLMGAMINFLIKAIISKIGMGFGVIDRGLGVGFGAVRGILVVAMIAMFINVSPFQQKVWYADSILTPKFEPMVMWLDHFIPQKINQVSTLMNNNFQNLEIK